MRIKEINYGIASRVGDTVFLNKHLNRYPRLRNALISHEKAHTSGFTTEDLLIDISINELKGIKNEYYSFVLRNPSSWIEFLPIKKYGDSLLINYPLLVIWLFIGVMTWSILISIL